MCTSGPIILHFNCTVERKKTAKDFTINDTKRPLFPLSIAYGFLQSVGAKYLGHANRRLYVYIAYKKTMFLGLYNAIIFAKTDVSLLLHKGT